MYILIKNERFSEKNFHMLRKGIPIKPRLQSSVFPQCILTKKRTNRKDTATLIWSNRNPRDMCNALCLCESQTQSRESKCQGGKPRRKE